jgi:hypothetical protein
MPLRFLLPLTDYYLLGTFRSGPADKRSLVGFHRHDHAREAGHQLGPSIRGIKWTKCGRRYSAKKIPLASKTCT